MTESYDFETDPVIQRVIGLLTHPVDVGSQLDQRILAELRRSPRRAFWHGGGAWGLTAGLAAMAGIAAITVRWSPDDGAKVRFRIAAPGASRVVLVGDFNDWSPAGTPLRRDGRTDEWSVRLSLSPGRYRFSFLLDGHTWRPDPILPSAPDVDFGVPTSVITVEDQSR